ncbi:MAG TPA: fumarylacetoacetate hydrolase family protein [Vicinamibacterales bacterium]
MHLYRLATSILVHDADRWFRLSDAWDAVVNRDDLASWLREQIASLKPLTGTPDLTGLQPPIGSQEVWAAGVTYYRSRTARMEESKSAGGGDFYDRVYEAERPELFFKATPHRVRGHQQAVRIRSDARWNVPEPELTLMVTSNGRIVGYTVGNDMSSRDIEGENPLYLPQAKVYDGSCALGPGLLVAETPLPPSTEIVLTIARAGATVYEGRTTLDAMRRTPESLVEFLFRDNTFPAGCLLLTGTGIVPPDDFTLASGDEIAIAIEPIGTLVNVVA